MRFFAFLRSRFLSLGVGSGASSVVKEKAFLLLLLRVGVKGELGKEMGSRPWSSWSWDSWRRRRASCLWRSSWALLLRRQVSQLWAWPVWCCMSVLFFFAYDRSESLLSRHELEENGNMTMSENLRTELY